MFLNIENLIKFYSKDDPLIKDLNFSVNKGEFVSFIGESGSGKTTFLNYLSGNLSGELKKNILFLDEFNYVEQPTGQPLHVDLTDFRSQGLALNLYEVDVNAPTGQICTVLPEK